LIAKGYGSADPIASNDTPEGRLRNRRIEYRVVKTP
jgi:peptidoglycan-binding protein ArfA